ncbi:MAG: phosphotransferase [Anaerolineae bacterium]|jgi:Ser/Thr protein kinase RdoA (MazF antagonist)|nr:phosphotransferase [Anaerolineae bacterium]MBT7072542.1 phosphotransferase [Anaerolineae bacterium]MBT7323648.1 phosphotransferase [Anaerolineae bacterium]
MKPYEKLTFRGKILRLRKLCIQALEDYPIDVARVRYLTTESTTMYRVDATDGQKYVIRLYSEADSSLAENKTEMFWLAALAKDTDLRVVQPVARKDGEYISFVSMEGIPNEKRCALYKWVPGVPLEEHVSVKTYHQLGTIMAGLHNHAEGMKLPGEIKPKRWDKTFYFPGEKADYKTAEFSHLYTPEQIKTLDRAVAYIDPFLAAIYKKNATPFVIHGDLHFWNIHIHRGKLYVLDFEDMVMGFAEQDIAISLYYLRNETLYPELAEAFKTGYASVRMWPHLPERDIHLFWLARMVNFANYAAIAFREDDGAREYISARCVEIEKYLS